MSIFDIFSFKKESNKVFSKENITEVLELARSGIVDLVKSNIPGVEKKTALDALVITRIKTMVATCNNKLVLWLVEQLIKVIPNVTQIVYNNLKEKVENL